MYRESKAKQNGTVVPFPPTDHNGLELWISFWEPGHKHNTVNSGEVGLFLSKHYFKMDPNEKVFTEKILLLLIMYVRHFRAARKTFPKNLAFSNTLKYTHTHTNMGGG